MVYWKACNSKSSVCEEEYWNTVCAVAVAYQGKNWACQQLKGSFDDSSGLSSRQTDFPTHHDALPVAAYRGDRSTVETLLKKGADVNASSGCLGYALYAAVYRGNTDIVGVLLDQIVQQLLKDADVNAQGGKRWELIQSFLLSIFKSPSPNLLTPIHLTLPAKRLCVDDLHLASVFVLGSILSSTPKHHDRVPGISK
jgi:hypothetical protein